MQCLGFDRDAMEAFVSVTTEMVATRKPGQKLEDQKENIEFFALHYFFLRFSDKYWFDEIF